MAAPLVRPEWTAVEPIPMPTCLAWPDLGERTPHVLRCPTCGHHVTVFVDTFGGDQELVEDCPVCCRPIELMVEASDYLVDSVLAHRTS